MVHTELTLKNLNRCFDYAYNDEAKYLAIMVSNTKENTTETIISPASDFPVRNKYFNEAYNEDLTLKRAPFIRIVGFTQADSFDEIQALLGV